MDPFGSADDSLSSSCQSLDQALDRWEEASMLFTFCVCVCVCLLNAEGRNEDAAEPGQEVAHVAVAPTALSGRPGSGAIACCLSLEKKEQRKRRDSESTWEGESMEGSSYVGENLFNIVPWQLLNTTQQVV